MKMGEYEKLREIYPEHISKVQLYQICKISPRSAQYLLDNRIIPFLDTGKTTWRYRIALTDVIIYLRRREQVGSMIPTGKTSSERKPSAKPAATFAEHTGSGDTSAVLQFFKSIFSGYPDVLTLTDVSEMTGITKETIRKFISEGELKTLGTKDRRHIIPKKFLLDFVISDRFLTFRSNSAAFKKIIGGFEIWKNAR